MNVSPEMEYFNCIVPCGIQKPVTSLEAITGRVISYKTIIPLVVESFSKVFECRTEPRTQVRGRE